MSTWRAYVRDAFLQPAAALDAWEVLNLTPRFNQPGSWDVTVPIDSREADALAAARAGLVVWRGDDRQVLSGPVTQLTVDPSTGAGKKPNLHAWGLSDDYWPETRVACPVPGGPPYTSAAEDVFTGAAESALKHYVDVNVGFSATPARHVYQYAVVVDSGRGLSGTWRGRWQSLGDLLRSIAIDGGGLGFRTQQQVFTGFGTFVVFDVYQPVDRSADVQFAAELGNLQAGSYTAKAPTASHAYALGSGSGAGRLVAEDEDDPSVFSWWRVETAVDQSNLSDAGELAMAAQRAVTQGAAQSVVKLVPTLDAGPARWPDDFDLGDTVSAWVNGVRVVDVVRELAITVTKDGEVVVPTIGPVGAQGANEPWFLSDLRSLRSRVNQLERG